MTTEKGTPKLVEIVLPARNEKVRVKDIPELLATALYPEIPEDTPRQVIELAKARSRFASGERINLAIKRQPPGEQFKRPLGYCRLQSAPSRKRNPPPIEPDQLVYVQVPTNALLPLDESDWKQLSVVWANLPALKLPIDEPTWQSYLVEYQKNVRIPWRKKWELCMNVTNLFKDREKKWSAAVAESTEMLRHAIDQHQLQPRSPLTGLPVLSSLPEKPRIVMSSSM